MINPFNVSRYDDHLQKFSLQTYKYEKSDHVGIYICQSVQSTFD